MCLLLIIKKNNKIHIMHNYAKVINIYHTKQIYD
jgi:hypothetical protein